MANTTDSQIQDRWNEETVYGPSTVITALDQIEDLVESSHAASLPASVMVNKVEILNLLDQARKALPKGLVATDTVVADADAILGHANSTAETRIVEAGSYASLVLGQANKRAAQILADAEEGAEHTRSRIDDEAAALASQACSDAEATIAGADVQTARIISTENIACMAEGRTREIIPEAERSVTSPCEGADNYAASLLDEFAHLTSDLVRRIDVEHRTIVEHHGVDIADANLTNE